MLTDTAEGHPWGLRYSRSGAMFRVREVGGSNPLAPTRKAETAGIGQEGHLAVSSCSQEDRAGRGTTRPAHWAGTPAVGGAIRYCLQRCRSMPGWDPGAHPERASGVNCVQARTHEVDVVRVCMRYTAPIPKKLRPHRITENSSAQLGCALPLSPSSGATHPYICRAVPEGNPLFLVDDDGVQRVVKEVLWPK